MANEFENIGRPTSDLLQVPLDNCQKILFEFAEGLVKDSKEKLVLANKGPGTLSSSIAPTISPTVYRFGKPLSIEISMEDYWKYVDGDGTGFGRRPNQRQPPTKAIEEWIKGKPQVQAKFGRKQPLESLAFIIARSIGKKGIKATPFWTSTINDGRLEKLGEDLGICFAKDIDVILNKL